MVLFSRNPWEEAWIVLSLLLLLGKMSSEMVKEKKKFKKKQPGL